MLRYLRFMIKKWIFLLGLMLVMGTPLYPADAKFYNINDIYGISMREAYSVCQDEKGFVWASAKTGILRITRDEQRVYQLPYKTADVVSVKLIYENSLLVAYTHNGQIFSYNELYDRFDLLADLRQSLRHFFGINAIKIDPENNLWIATSRGLYVYKENMFEVVSDGGVDVQNIHFLDDRRMLLATEKGLWLMDIETRERDTIYAYATDHEIRVSSILHDPKNDRLWIGSLSTGLYNYDMREELLSEISLKDYPRQPILALEESSDSTLFVGFDGQGVWEIKKDGNSVMNIYKEDPDNPYSLRGDGVYDILCDNSRRVWVATYSGGISFFDQESPMVTQITHKINNPHSLANNQVNQVIQDSKGNIWFATNNGISRWSPALNRWDGFYQNKYEQAKAFTTLCEDINGNIWAGTYSSGVYILNGNTGEQLLHYSHDKHDSNLSGKFILDIFRDNKGDMWIGGVYSEIMRYSVRDNRFYTYQAEPVRSFAQFTDDKILLACTYGLLLLDPDSGSVETLLNGCLVQEAIAVGDTIWVATSGNGLIQYNYATREVEKFTTESGLISDHINSLQLFDGCLWLGTEKGLCGFDLSKKSAFTYPSVYPLSHTSFNGSASYRLTNGALIWGTNRGAVVFNPRSLSNPQFEGQIYFQDILVSGRSIREDSRLAANMLVDEHRSLSLGYNQNSLVLELLPIAVSAPGSKFSWRLDGLDAEWSEPTDRPTISYPNLPTGKFRLDIKMYDNSLSQVIDERAFFLRINPPFWATWWFRTLLLLFMGGIVYFSLRAYVSRLKQKHAEDKARFFTNMAHDIRTSLTLVSAPIEALRKEKNLSEKGRYYLSLASEQSGRLSSITTQLLDFQKVDIGKGQFFPAMTDVVSLISKRKLMFDAEAEKKGVVLEFCSEQECYVTAIDEIKIVKVVDNLISNAIKYSHSGGKVRIVVKSDEKEWSLEVSDQGKGISDQALKKLFKEFYREDNPVNSKIAGSGIGLLLVKSYVSLHQGTVSVQSKEQEGALFKVTIPYRFETNQAKEEACDLIPEDAEKVSESIVPPDLSLSESDKKGMKPHVLLVEDNNELQLFLKSSLDDQYLISTADDGEEAWRMIGERKPDLIISDIMMPLMDGFELCRLIKSTFETSHVPVILLTALSDKAKQLQGLGLGADDYITKPFDMTILNHRIQTIIKNRKAVQEKAIRLITQTGSEQPLFENELNDKFIKRALEVVQANLSDNKFGKEEFASAMNVSSSLLYKKTKALTGLSPVELIRTIRLKHACELLKTKKHSVTEVSELCGFSSATYFSTVFKKHFGKSPIEL